MKIKTIAIFSPSMPISVYYPERFKRAVTFLEKQGFKVILGNLTYHTEGYRSGNIQERANEFNQLLYNQEVDCILASIGGMNTNSILPYIDYDYLKAHPKLIVGYSDVSALLNAVYAKTGIHTVYGPALTSAFGEIGPLADASFIYFKKLFIEHQIFPHAIPKPHAYTDEHVDWETQTDMKKLYVNNWKTVKNGVATGRLIISNLGTLAYTFNTEYFPEIKAGDILVLEDTMDNPMQVERSYAHLKLAHVFDIVGGIIIGKHASYDDLTTKKQPEDILLEFVKRDIPILANVDIGHTLPVLSLPIGGTITLDATNQKIIVEEI